MLLTHTSTRPVSGLVLPSNLISPCWQNAKINDIKLVVLKLCLTDVDILLQNHFCDCHENNNENDSLVVKTWELNNALLGEKLDQFLHQSKHYEIFEHLQVNTKLIVFDIIIKCFNIILLSYLGQCILKHYKQSELLDISIYLYDVSIHHV